MSTRRNDEAAAGRALRAASAEYDDLPAHVADRLDRVLGQLPAADTLHAREEAASPWRERLRLKRVRYALVSATAAFLVTIGAVAIAVQYVAAPGGQDDATVLAEHGDRGAGEDQADDTDAGAVAPDSELEAAEEDAQELDEPRGIDETTDVETFTTGRDYSPDVDLLGALRELGAGSTTGSVPGDLEALAQGGKWWQNCQNAIAEWYDGLLVAVDFARYDSEPAVVALLAVDSGEIAVAVTPECAQGIIDELVSQR